MSYSGSRPRSLPRTQTSTCQSVQVRGACATTTRRAGNLPAAVSSFVGRSRELAEVSDLIGTRRLVTLVGPGGAGKTRLALEVGERVRADFDDGVWLIEFAPLKSGSDVASAVATALGLDDSGRLERYVAQRRMLLLFDNCEHVIDDAASVAASVLRAGPGVRCWQPAASVSGQPGKCCIRSTPSKPTMPLSCSSSGHAQVGLPAGAVDQLDAITRICDQLDRMPLALELAAARTRSLSLDEIVERVEDRFALLTGGDRTAAPRHQTLRGVVDWSYELLFSAEQRVFRYVAIFAGGFDLHAAESVCASEETPTSDIIDLLGNLVDKSLVTVSHRDGQARYTLLQTLVDYGRDRLHDAGEDGDARDRHLLLDGRARHRRRITACGARPSWPGSSGRGRERDNIRAALAWAVEQGRAADAVDDRCRVRVRLVHQRRLQRRPRIDHPSVGRRR